MQAKKVGQTYKIAGQQQFRCSDCGNYYANSNFNDIEFHWQDKPDEWKEYMKSKGVDVS